MKIGIFGGTFDPPHIGHLILAEFVREQVELDCVWLAPTLDPPHKLEREKTPASQRYEMVKLACDDDPFILPSDIDLVHNRKPSYTIDLLDEISQENPHDEFILIIGADSVIEFTTWHRWREILSKYRVVAVRRPYADIADAHPDVIDSVEILESPLLELSSSDIRRRIREGHSVRYMMTKKAFDFIMKNNLYVKT